MVSYLQLVVPYRRSTRRRQGLNPVQSYKQVTVDGPASRAPATNITHSLVIGVDNYTGPSANNNEVPTGAKVMSLLLLLCFGSIASPATTLHFTLQLLRSGQGIVTPGAVGGNPQRNQVLYTEMLFVTADQSLNQVVRIKIPKMFQRIREGDVWQLVYSGDTTFTSVTQSIYKFFR